VRTPTTFMLPLLAVLLVGCDGSPASRYERVSGEGASWGVGASKPRFESLDPCDKDPSVETSSLSADMPSSALGIRLLPGSTEADALRIADCLSKALASGEIWISSPAE
jgi:hypothetical protein